MRYGHDMCTEAAAVNAALAEEAAIEASQGPLMAPKPARARRLSPADRAAMLRQAWAVPDNGPRKRRFAV